ncbi:MAG: hypothetical protein ABIX28_11210 [Vicinamibacterales bacterium]
MPIIKARSNRARSVRHICRLQEPNRDALAIYARLIGDSADYVLNRLIETTLGKDRDFVAGGRSTRMALRWSLRAVAWEAFRAGQAES